MSFIGEQLFDFTKRVALQSRFSHSGLANRLSQHLAPKRVFKKPQVLYQQLQQGQVSLSLIDVLMLIGWRSEVWLSESGRVAMQHWWQSALADTAQPILRLIMMLRVVLADSERWPGPRAVIQAMSDEMQTILQNRGWPNQPQADVLLLLIQQQTKTMAELAIGQSLSLYSLMQQVGLPSHLPTVLVAEEQWLSLWIAKNRQQRAALASQLRQTLHADLTLQRQQLLAKCILSHPLLPQQTSVLKAKVADYPELVAWLSACARHSAFRLGLNEVEKNLLRCWIGTGNYEALRGLLIQLATHNQDNGSLQKTENRYIFWRNYQNLFEEAWLLVPFNIYATTSKVQVLSNVRPISDLRDPVAVLKINNFYIFQVFIGDGNPADSDLLMTDDVAAVEFLLAKERLSYQDIQRLNLCLIHDHKYCWQADLAQTLDKSFNIVPQQGRIDITPHMQRAYAEEVKTEQFQQERRAQLRIWLNGASRRHGALLLKKIALSALRNGAFQ